MKHFLLALVISVSFITGIIAQDQYTKEKLNRIVPVSPNTASLGIFGSIPVGHHTGVPQISIPIHEIDFHGLKIPIELSYHASGIKVGQDASSVGLGWALNAGGCITRNILHLDDFEYNWGNYRSTKVKPPYSEEEDPEFDTRDYLPFMGFSGTYDSEPDFFTYSFCGHSGSFYLQPRGISNGLASNMGKENFIQIRYIESGNKWEVIDAYGFKYIFGPSEDTKETTQTYSRPGVYTTDISSINRATFNTKDQPPSVTAWYLESIISPFNDVIKFKYRKERLLSQYHFSEEKYFRVSSLSYNLENIRDQYDYSFISYSSNEQLLLSSIEYNGGSIEFGYEVRTDLQLSNVTNIAQKLTSISVYENLTRDNHGGKKRVKYCTLSHSYMGVSPTNSEFSRLMLDEVCFMSVDNLSNDMKKYQFTYNYGDLPSKYSQAFDYWGYYNGQGSFIRGTHRDTDISPFIYLGNNWAWENLSFGGRYRTPNENYAKYGMLHSIKYPTGGKTVFEFELNEFWNKIRVGTLTGNVDLDRGAGLRVKRIIDVSNDIDTVSIRHFLYKEGGESSGRLKISPEHYRYVDIQDFYYGHLPYFTWTHKYINIHSESFSTPILNSGNIGYRYVEEHNITDGKNNGYTSYHFSNQGSSVKTSVFGIPTTISSLSGKPMAITHYNGDGNRVKRQLFEYRAFDIDSIIGFKSYTPPMYDSYFIFNNKLGTDFKVAYYSLYSDCYVESKITEEKYFPNGTITQIIEYGYDEISNLRNYQKTTVNGNVYETQIRYPSDFMDPISISMKNEHIIGVPIETINLLNGSVIDAQKTVYSTFWTHDLPSYLPESIYGLRKSQPLSLSTYQNYYDKEIQIDAYDSFGNVLQYTDRDNLKVVYLWSNGVYPIAVIKNATVEDVDLALIQLNIDMVDLSLWRPDLNYLSGLQEQLPNAQVTLFTHKPQLGVTSISTPSGKVVYYDYDGLGRLIHVKNRNENKIESYEYNYSNR